MKRAIILNVPAGIWLHNLTAWLPRDASLQGYNPHPTREGIVQLKIWSETFEAIHEGNPYIQDEYAGKPAITDFVKQDGELVMCYEGLDADEHEFIRIQIAKRKQEGMPSSFTVVADWSAQEQFLIGTPACSDAVEYPSQYNAFLDTDKMVISTYENGQLVGEQSATKEDLQQRIDELKEHANNHEQQGDKTLLGSVQQEIQRLQKKLMCMTEHHDRECVCPMTVLWTTGCRCGAVAKKA